MSLNSTPNLNPNYFAYIATFSDADYNYHAFEPVGNPLILISQDNTPLVSIHLTHNNNRGNALIARKSQDEKENHFQGMVKTANCPFEFVLTNLTDYRTEAQKNSNSASERTLNGMVNINLMGEDQDHDVRIVNPGGLNQWNEVSPYRSAVIESDQNSKPYPNSRLILREVMQAVAPGGVETTVTVAEDDAAVNAKTQSKSKCASYFPTVHAQKGCVELEEKFKQEKRWVTSNEMPFILIRTKIAPVRKTFSFNSRSSTRSLQSRSFGDRSHESVSFSSNNETVIAPCSMNFGTALSNSRSSRGSEGDSNLQSMSFSFSDARESNTKSKSALTAGLVNLLNTSNIGQVAHGECVDIDTIETDADYVWDYGAPKCKLSLSIQPKLQFCSLDRLRKSDIESQAQELINSMNQGKYAKFLLENQIYKSECYICLEDDPATDIVFYPCGHQCLHKACNPENNQILNCGLCRARVAAKLNI